MKQLFFLCLCLSFFSAHAQKDLEISLNKAQLALNEENYSDAVKHLSKVLEYKNQFNSKNKLAGIYISRAQCRYKLGNISAAEKDFDEALELSPELIRIYDARIEMYAGLKDWEKMLETCLKAHTINKKNLGYLSQAALGYVELHDFTKARPLLDSVLKQEPSDSEALNTLSAFYTTQNKFNEALEVNNKFIQLYPNDAGGYLNRSICHAELKEFDKALADNDYAVKLDSGYRHVAYNNNAFFILIKQNKFAEAIDYLDKAINLKPNFAYAFSNRGFCKLKLGRTQEALKDLNKSLELDNTNSYAHKNMALIKLEQNKKGEACEWLNKAKKAGYSVRYDNEVDELLKTHCK